ncbi:cation transporter [Fibrobacterales bacterium]|nr:cation transporter [Fibrobacterales bacterium]
MKFLLQNRLFSVLLILGILVWGISVAPFDFGLPNEFRNPINVDAIPDLGENQQIVATEWMGRSPKDIQEQITYPLTTALLGIPGVKTIRSTSMFGMSFIYIIFDEEIEFYWSRSRILEKLNSLPASLLPADVKPALGTDATALGQVFWYTLEGRNPKTGEPNGGWSSDSLRSVQDFYVKYNLAAAGGVAEVASIGGFVKEYQIEINPSALTNYKLSIMDVMGVIQKNNLDIGAETIEMNKVEYMVRGIGYIKSLSDIEESVVAVQNGAPVRLKDIAFVNVGPATRRGGLDKEGVEAVGGVAVARHGANPMQVINNIKEKIREMNAGLPSKILADGTESKIQIVPFYDRSILIEETIGTLKTALSHEILICILVVTVLVFRLRASLVIASLLPLAVLATFIIMSIVGIEANVVALSGIAIAIGVMVDVGVVMVESIIKNSELQIKNNSGDSTTSSKDFLNTIYTSVKSVTAPLLTGMATTIIGFIPVFALTAQEGKLFKPLAYTKSFALISALLLGFAVLPTIAYYILGAGGLRGFAARLSPRNALKKNALAIQKGIRIFVIVIATIFLAVEWLPLGHSAGIFWNVLFVVLTVGVILAFLWSLVFFYEKILRWCLAHKTQFLILPVLIIIFGLIIWKNTGKEFMPNLDEGTFLLMPTAMPHTGIERTRELISELDKRISSIPEIESTIGKWGRANSALDPAPVQMFENTINYKTEFTLDSNGQTIRQWRPHIKSADDIWNEIVKVTELPGLTSAPKLAPIAARQVMLSTGMRASMGIKVSGPNLEAIEQGGKLLETALKEVPSIKSETVFYDRSVSAPYLEIHLERTEMARYGLNVEDLQNVISAAVGGMSLTNTVEGRERYSVRLRYPRELRNSPDALEKILIPTMGGAQIPLGSVAKIEFAKGAQMINSENTFLTGFVLFDKVAGIAEVDAVENAQDFLLKRIESGQLKLPNGVSYKFSGTYEQQQHAAKTLLIVIPVALLAIFLVLFMQFKTITASCIHFSGVFVAFAGGFIMLWLYGENWFLNFEISGINLREVFHIHEINLSVAVWVGFIALFGIATNDGVLMGTYIHETFLKINPKTKIEIQNAVVIAGSKRIRPAAMTTATTLIALLPVLTSTGKGSDIMVPMAIPAFGGMLIQSITMFVVPVLQCVWRERAVTKNPSP